MILFGWLMGLFLPACAATGAQGLQTPRLMDVTQIVRPSSPNTALAAPAGFVPAPDTITPDYAVPPLRLFRVVEEVAAGEPRTYPAVTYASALQAHWVVRSAVFNFPDLVMAQILPGEAGGSRLVLYSRSVYGYSDLGANRKRVGEWLAAINRVIGQPAKKMNNAA
jgi:uncharacterized protein (DUF1499 family)